LTATNKAIAVAVDTTEQDARFDLRTAAAIAAFMPPAMVRLHDVKRTIRRTVANWESVEGCTVNGKPWAWMNWEQEATR
jgi:hypothetical protein